MNHDYTETAQFATVGALKELLRPYSNNTPIYVCGEPGLFTPNEEVQCILLAADDCRYAALRDRCDDYGYLKF